MKKILISVTYIKDIGGVSTSIINLLNEIHDKYDITLVVPSKFISNNRPIPPNIKVITGSNYLHDIIPSRAMLSFQNLPRKVLRNSRRIINRLFLKEKGIEIALDKIIIPDEYDVAIAFADFVYNIEKKKCYDYYVVLNNVSAKKKIAWIHNNPTKLGWTKELILKEMSGFDSIVNVSKGCKQIFDSIIPEYTYKSVVAYNMYNIDKIKTDATVNINLYPQNNKLHIVTVARIQIEQKRIDRIVEVCKNLVNENITNFDWTLVGEGPDLPELKHQAEKAGLNDYIRFVGLKHNPFPYVKQADIFVQSSDYEGYGMTVKEAQILETPTFITNYIAASEVVENGVQGEICENSTEGLYKMIKSVINNPQKLEVYRQNLINSPVNNNLALEQFNNICEM